MGEEIKILDEGTLKEIVEKVRKTSILKNPKLVHISLTFRSDNGVTEKRGMSHETYNQEDYE